MRLVHSGPPWTHIIRLNSATGLSRHLHGRPLISLSASIRDGHYCHLVTIPLAPWRGQQGTITWCITVRHVVMWHQNPQQKTTHTHKESGTLWLSSAAFTGRGSLINWEGRRLHCTEESFQGSWWLTPVMRRRHRHTHRTHKSSHSCSSLHTFMPYHSLGCQNEKETRKALAWKDLVTYASERRRLWNKKALSCSTHKQLLQA